MDYSSAFPVSFQGHNLYWLVGTGAWSLVNGDGPDVSHGFTWLFFAAFLGLELKYSWGLDVSDMGQNLIALGA